MQQYIFINLLAKLKLKKKMYFVCLCTITSSIHLQGAVQEKVNCLILKDVSQKFTDLFNNTIIFSISSFGLSQCFQWTKFTMQVVTNNFACQETYGWNSSPHHLLLFHSSPFHFLFSLSLFLKYLLCGTKAKCRFW